MRVQLPEGLLEPYVEDAIVADFHKAVKAVIPRFNGQKIQVSVSIGIVPAARWGINGEIWHLNDFAKMGGYKHLADLADGLAVRA